MEENMQHLSEESPQTLLKSIKQRLRLFMNGAVSQSMRQKGLEYKLNMGVDLPRLKQVASEYQPSAALASLLWKEDVRECRILATMLFPKDEFMWDLAQVWVDQMPTVEIAQIASQNLFRHLSYARSLSLFWIASDSFYRQLCGLHVLARLLMHETPLPVEVENEILDQTLSLAMGNDMRLVGAAFTVLRSYMRIGEDKAFSLCRRCDGLLQEDSERSARLRIFLQEETSLWES